MQRVGSASKRKKGGRFAVIWVSAHGMTVKSERGPETRSITQDAYPSNVTLLSTMGHDLVPGVTEKLPGSHFSNYFTIPTGLAYALRDIDQEGQEDKTGDNILGKIKRMIEPLDKAAGVFYENGYQTLHNPSDLRVYFMRPNDGESHRGFENQEYEGTRPMRKRATVDTDIQWFQKYGVYLLYTNCSELEGLSLHGSMSAMRKRKMDLSRYGMDKQTDFIYPREFNRINIFDRRTHKYFERILMEKNTTTPNYDRDVKRGIQIIRKGVVRHRVTLPELSQLARDLDIDDLYVFVGACQCLDEMPLEKVMAMWNREDTRKEFDSQSTTSSISLDSPPHSQSQSDESSPPIDDEEVEIIGPLPLIAGTADDAADAADTASDVAVDALVQPGGKKRTYHKKHSKIIRKYTRRSKNTRKCSSRKRTKKTTA